MKISEQTHTILLNLVLTYLAVRMTLFPTLSEAADWKARPIALWAALLSGVVIGLLSGILGIGGGIFLLPLIILAQWDGLMGRMLISVNHEYAFDEAIIPDKAEIALFPPVSGG